MGTFFAYYLPISAADITAMALAATAHKLYHTTYYNHRETAQEVQAITYGAELPEDLAANMAGILTAAGGENDAV